MNRTVDFMRLSAVNTALIVGLLMCCSVAFSGGPDDQSTTQPTAPTTPPTVKKVKTEPPPKPYQPPAPETLKIGQGMNPLALSGPQDVGVDAGSQPSQGWWAIHTIQKITKGLTPSQSEVARFAAKDDLTAGEDLAKDDTIDSGLLPTHVKSSSVVLELPITWTETGFQDLALGQTGCSPSSPECIGATSFEDGAVGVYGARVEVCLSTSDSTKLNEVKDKEDKPIKCTTADGVPQREGFWYDVSDDPWTYTTLTAPSVTRLFENKTNSWSWFEPQPTGLTDGTFSIPVDLPVPVNSLRVEIELGLKDPHATSDKKTSQSEAIAPLPSDPYVESMWGVVNPQGGVESKGGPELLATRFAIQLPNITVLPAAFLTMKVLPYTILYRPPGDKSQGSFQTTESYGTSMTTGVSTSIDNTTAFMESQDVKTDAKITALILSIEHQEDSSTSSTGATDNNSTVGTGLVTGNSHSQVRQWTLGSGGGDPTILPAAESVTPNTCAAANYVANACTLMQGETFYQEPFWEDQIVVLLNPTAEVWDFKAGTTVQLLGAQDYDKISITDLAACATNTEKYGWTLSNQSKLTPAECLDLLTLDPYYLAGQSFDPSKSNRGLFVGVGSGNYGGDPRNPTAAPVVTGFQDVFNYSTAQSTSASASYQSTVTNVTGFSWSNGMSLNAKQSVQGLDLGISGGVTVTQGNQNTLGAQMKVSYSASTVGTSTEATQISGSFADDYDFDTPACQNNSVKCYTPQVKVYIDELFGSYMFSDPDAPPNPLAAGILPVRLKVAEVPAPAAPPQTGITKATIPPIVSPVVYPAASDLEFGVIYINAANLLDPSKIKGTLQWSKGELSLEEGGKQIFKATAADIKGIEMNTVLGVSAGSFYILLSNGKKYDFWAASLKASDTKSIADTLKSAVH